MKRYNGLRAIVLIGGCSAYIGLSAACAENTKTQLEMNQYVFEIQSPSHEMRPIDYMANIVFLRPLEVVKTNAENVMLLHKATIVHDQDVHRDSRQTAPSFTMAPYEKTKTEGPKISFSF